MYKNSYYIYVCVRVCKGKKKRIFKVYINLKTNEKLMVNNKNYIINKIFNEIILKKLSCTTCGYVTSSTKSEISGDRVCSRLA